MIATLILCVACATLLYVSYVDIVTHRISNELVLVVAGLYVPYALVQQLPLTEIGIHISTGAVMLVLGFALYSVGLRFGGGDVKLFAALSIWCGFVGFLLYFVVMCFAGGALAFLVMGLRSIGVPQWLDAHGWNIPAFGSEAQKSYIPYAPAMTAGFVIAVLYPDVQF